MRVIERSLARYSDRLLCPNRCDATEKALGAGLIDAANFAALTLGTAALNKCRTLWLEKSLGPLLTLSANVLYLFFRLKRRCDLTSE
jgi:hypothetical protein